MLDSNDDIDEDNEIPFEIPNGFELAETPPDVTRSLFLMSTRRTPLLMISLGMKSFTTGLQLVGLKEKV